MSLRIELRIPDAFHARATHALETLALAWGTPVTIGASPLAESTVVYGEDAAGSDSRLVLPFDHRAYDPATPFAKRRVEGVPVWAPADDDGRPADLVGATHRLLAFLDEQQIPEARRDRRGIFLSADLPAGRGEATADPLVEDMAGLLWRLLLQAHPGLERDVEPRWPEGKRWALALSHDTDAVRLGAWAEVGTNLAKSLLRRDATAWRMARLGLAFRSTPGADPAFGFPRWRAWEGERGLRSAFYLFVMPPKAWRDPNECKSTVLDPAVDWGLFREMADDGWEFGLHAPIASTPDLDVLLWCKHAIETRLHRPIHGLRHHYWALDWRRPHLTYRRHVNAGFRYDTSIAWRDRAGFRAGTALPFRPFDPGRERSLQIEVLPTALMDGHVIRNPQVEHPEPAVSRLFERIRGVGGLALLDWHTETAWNRLRHAGYLDHLAAFLDPVLEDASCWKATPWEIARHWHRRRSLLLRPPGPVVAARRLRVGVLGMPDNATTPALLSELAANGIEVDFVVYWRPAAKDQWRRAMRKLRAAGPAGVLERIRTARRSRVRETIAGGERPATGPRAYQVSHHNSEECRRILLDEGVDVLITATDAILKRSIFSAARIATLNGHPGWLPAYRGLGATWYQMERGLPPAMSVHRVDEGIDTGPVFTREWLPADAGIPDDLERQLMQARARALARVIRRLARGEAVPLDLQLEPSNMTRGMSHARRRRLEARLRSGALTLTEPASSSGG